MAANIFTGSVDSNYGTTGNWSLGVVPVSTDGNTATFNAVSPACTVNGARSCFALDMSAYANTITGAGSNWTIAGTGTAAVTFGTGMTVAGTLPLVISRHTNLTTNGFVWANAVTLTGAITVTLADDWTVQGLFTIGSATGTITFNGNNIYLEGSFNCGTALARICQGTTAFHLTGSVDATWTSTATFRNDLTINKGASTTLTLGSTLQLQSGTITWLSGIVDATTNSNIVYIGNSSSVGGNPTFDTSGMTWNTVSVGNTLVSYGFILLSNFQCVTFYVNCFQLVIIGAFDFECDNLEVMYVVSNGTGFRLAAGQTYTVNTSFRSWGSIVLPTKILSATPGSKAYIIYNGTNANQEITNCRFTDIDASGGNKLWTLHGTISNSDNVGVSNSSIVPVTVSSVF